MARTLSRWSNLAWLQATCSLRRVKRGLYYPPDPASLKNCSIGGNIATNAGGPRCLKYGVTRHYVLGLEVVLANGAIVRCGGRTHKNKTGFDLVGLFVGSEGLLGVVTEATLRLLPFPPARAALSAGFRNMRAAARAIQAIFAGGFLPAAVEVADRFTLEAAREFKPGASFPPGGAHLLLEVDGQPDSVRGEVRALAKLLRGERATAIETAMDDACERLWDLRRAFSESLKATGLKKLNEDIVVPRGKLVDLIEFAQGLQTRSGFPVACFGHAGDGNIHVNIMVGEYEDPQIHARADAALDELFSPNHRLGRGDYRRARHRACEEAMVESCAFGAKSCPASCPQAGARSQGATQSRKVRLSKSWCRTERSKLIPARHRRWAFFLQRRVAALDTIDNALPARIRSAR